MLLWTNAVKGKIWVMEIEGMISPVENDSLLIFIYVKMNDST